MRTAYIVLDCPVLKNSSVPRKRAGRLASGGAIREAATALFLERGYAGATMDDVAAAAAVSKQTVYSHFHSKEALFADLVLGNTARVDEFIGRIDELIDGGGDLRSGLEALARAYLGFVVRPEAVRLRRLVIAEAVRFPELARTYYERVPERVYAALARALERRLDLDDPILAAHHLVWLVLGTPLDEALLAPSSSPPDNPWIARQAVRVFLAAYGSARADPA
jgi:TetR/AcrR family transcriptional repressor of mexJK operon